MAATCDHGVARGRGDGCTPLHRELAAAAGSHRWTAARLACGFAYAPFPVDRKADAPRALQRIGLRIRQECAKDRPGAWHALGVLDLLAGRTDHAAAELERALRLAPEDSGVLSDLAAAHLQRGLSQAQPLDRIAALDEAERAVRRQPSRLEALFNRALARQGLALPLQTAAAWVAYLARDPTSGWAQEAEAALAARRAPAAKELWEIARPRLLDAARRADRGAVAALVSRFPQEARMWVEEELLAAWAAAADGSGPPSPELTVARGVGTALADSSGESMLRDTVAAIDAARASDPRRLAAIREGLRAYQAGLSAVEARRFAAAEAPLERARAALSAGRCPFRWWASFLLLRCAYQRSAFADAERRARGILAGIAGSRYPVLAARAHWVLGTVQMALAQPAEALASYRSSLSRFEAAGEAGNAAAVQALLASAYQELGDAQAAWRERLRALPGLAQNDPDRLRLVFTDGAYAAVEAGFGEAAVTLQTEALHLAGRQPLPLATGRLNRAGILVGIGEPERALPDLTAAEQGLDRIADASVRNSVLADLLLVRGQALRRQPGVALAALRRALSMYRADGRRLLASLALEEEARALLQLGRRREAKDDLRQAMAMLEEERGAAPEVEHRAALLARRASVFSEMIGLLVSEGEAGPALDVAERSRSRVLLDWLAALPEKSRGRSAARPSLPVAADRLRRQLPPGIAVVCYAMLPDRLLVWIVHRDSIRLRSVPALPAWIQETANRFAERGAAEDGRRLYDLLLRPVRGDLAPGETVVLVPEGVLAAVPFGALYDAATGHYLIEERPVAVAPSLNAFVRLSARAGAGDFARSDLLLVADPAFDRSLFPDLPRLSGASDEGRQIAALFRRVEVVAGAAATRSALLSGLGGHRILQFSGHAVVSSRNPLLSALVLAPGAAGDSGVLYARELLAGAPGATGLVVLASCRSGVGAAAPGEGIAGLVWPLLARGVPAVIASLRQVDDAASARLFRAFYRHLAAGEAPVEALRAAQLERLAAAGRSPAAALRLTAFQLYGGVARPGDRQGGAS